MHSWIDDLVVVGLFVIMIHKIAQWNHASIGNSVAKAPGDDTTIKLIVYLPVEETFNEILWRIFQNYTAEFFELFLCTVFVRLQIVN